MNVQANTVLINTPFRGIENPLNLPKGRPEESIKMKRRLNE